MSIPQKLFLSVLSLLIILSFSASGSAETENQEPAEVKKGTATGKIMLKDGSPLSWGQVMFHDASTGPPPFPKKYDRIPDVSKITDAEGSFTVELPEGTYYLGAVKRLSGERFGPLEEGDYIFRSLDEQHNPIEYHLESGKVLALGSFSGAVQLTAEDFLKRRVTTAIKGVIRDMDWNPVKDAVVSAFVKPVIGGKPLFVSNRTDTDGRYTLRLTEGTYYLRVRNSFAAGPPKPGQIVGYYGEGAPAPVFVEECEIKEGFDFQVIVFPGRGPFSGTTPAPAPEKQE